MSPYLDLLPVRSTLKCGSRLLDLSKPIIMGIINVTPDSFYDGGRYHRVDQALERAEHLLENGASILDIGGMSTRPGANIFPSEEERKRVIPVISALHKRFPQAVISIDTVWSQTALEAADAGASLLNDVSAGRIDPQMYAAAGRLGLPYILMHMQGKPADMQHDPRYKNAPLEVLDFFIAEVAALRQNGVNDIVLDPGFGFGKKLTHNFQLLSNLHVFRMLECPILAGISRKSMICKTLDVRPEDALNGTTALHMLALQQGASILRVHDAREAAECIALYEAYQTASGQRFTPESP